MFALLHSILAADAGDRASAAKAAANNRDFIKFLLQEKRSRLNAGQRGGIVPGSGFAEKGFSSVSVCGFWALPAARQEAALLRPPPRCFLVRSQRLNNPPII
jgi:hypothetical protein